MIKLESELRILKHSKIAVLTIQDTELVRLSFDSYEKDGHSMVFFIDERDVITVDYDILIEF